ncbi:MAG: AarF/ABC1/UbiB kinase family protein, partial [Alphaproteobacteria bacterium]|nr:AarF/ABC1/UbiB kinase family protein [Alphaproteobacteria bacterium]
MKAGLELGEISRPVSSAAVTSGEVGRPPTGATRFWIAYFWTFRVVLSYLSLRFQARFRSPGAIETLTRKKHLRNARRIQRVISRLQGLFIKVGQLISIMTNFLPEEFRAELEGLQDQVPPRPYVDIERRFHEEFDGKRPADLFAELDERPIASASIGQVHRAKLPSGEQVAVKVQYPDIEEIVRIDLRALRRIFRVISWFVPYHGLEGIYREIRDMILQELDFRAEADNITRIASLFPGRRD